jgi:hypothetical protein
MHWKAEIFLRFIVVKLICSVQLHAVRVSHQPTICSRRKTGSIASWNRSLQSVPVQPRLNKVLQFAQLRRYIPGQPIGMKISTRDVRDKPPVQTAKMNENK